MSEAAPAGAARGAEAPLVPGGSPRVRAHTPGLVAQMARLPFGVQLVILFFLLDGLEKGVLLGARTVDLWRAGNGWPSLALLMDVHIQLALAVLFDLLLAVMLSLRTRAGRFWGVIYLCSLTGIGVALLVVEPARWLDQGVDGRLRELATYAINLGLAGILLGDGARRALIR